MRSNIPAVPAAVAALLLLFASSAVAQQTATPSSAQPPAATARGAQSIAYASGFTVARHNGYTLVTVTRPWPGATKHFIYLLVHRGAPVPSGYSGVPVIRVPIRSIVELSSTYLAETVELGEGSTITGVESLSYVYSPVVRAGIKSGRIATVGEGSSLNIERLIAMHPDVIMTSAFGGAGDVYPKLEEAGLPVVINGDWAERTPLGRAEWIKFIGLLYGKSAEADRIFSQVANEYHRLTAIAQGARTRPTVFANAPWQGTWDMPGGHSYMARLFHDAGANYLWKNTTADGALFLDFEAVFARAAHADYWIDPGAYATLAGLRAADPRFAQFDAFTNGRVYNNTARVTPDGGNDYWESGPANPQRVLRDLIEIFHPGLLPHGKLYYFKRLE